MFMFERVHERGRLVCDLVDLINKGLKMQICLDSDQLDFLAEKMGTTNESVARMVISNKRAIKELCMKIMGDEVRLEMDDYDKFDAANLYMVESILNCLLVT